MFETTSGLYRKPKYPFAEYTNNLHLHRHRYCGYFNLTMEIDLIFKIAAIGIIVSILNQVLSRSGRDEQATLTTLAGLIVVLMLIAQKIADLFDLVKTLFEF